MSVTVSVSQMLKACLKCGLSTWSEEELSKLFNSFPTEQREMDQGRRLLEAMLNPVLKLHRVTSNSDLKMPKTQQMYFLVCPVCKKTQGCLSTHLRRVCMKVKYGGTPELWRAAVRKARKEAKEVLANGRVFSYEHLRKMMANADPLSSMIEELQRRRMLVVTDVQRELHRPGSTSQQWPDVKWKTMPKKLMAERGLYKKHSLNHPLLKGFSTYLKVDMDRSNHKQEVQNVARFLYYMNPREVSLEFVRNKEKTRKYLRELDDAKLKHQTQLTYIKSVQRFLKYHTYTTNLRLQNEKLYEDCVHFIHFTRALQNSSSKKVSKEITKKKYNMLIEENKLTPKDCLAVLRAAKKDFLIILGKVYPEQSITLHVAECAFVLYYLEALVILKHLQRPGVVKGMTVDEWIGRKTTKSGHAIIGVKDHKNGAQQVAMFALSPKQELWFDIYFTQVRPILLSAKPDNRKRKRKASDANYFFISTTGRQIHNPTSDLKRLHNKVGRRSVTSQETRRVFETATKCMSDIDKSLVADYLTHTVTVAEKHYRMKEPDNILKANRLLAKLAGESSADEADDTSNHDEPACRSRHEIRVQRTKKREGKKGR